MELPKNMTIPYELALRLSSVLAAHRDEFMSDDKKVVETYIAHVSAKKAALVRRIEYGLDQKGTSPRDEE